jgi:hypothetical protein
MKLVFLVLPLPFLVSACAEEARPEPDPVALERLVASMEAEPVAAGITPPDGQEEKDEVGRIANSLQKVDVDRVDPALAEALIGG